MDWIWMMSLILGTFFDIIKFCGHANIPHGRVNFETACIPWNASPCIRALNDTEKTQLIQTCGLVQSPLSNAQNSTIKVVNGQLADFRQSSWSAFVKLPGLVHYFFKLSISNLVDITAAVLLSHHAMLLAMLIVLRFLTQG
jgi:hypothetical protein